MSNDSKEFFERLVRQHKFILRPNKNKNNNPKFPDLMGTTNSIDEDGSLYIIYGWIRPEKGTGIKVLNVVMSKFHDQKTAQELFKAGKVIPSVEIPDDFNLNENELII